MSRSSHLSDETLDERSFPGERSRADRAHLETCETCRARVGRIEAMHRVLEEQSRVAYRPGRDLVPGAVKRLRVRNHAIVNTNELLNLFVAFVRGFGSLFAVEEPSRDPRRANGPTKDDAHE